MAAYQLDANPQWIKIASFTAASISVAATTQTITCDPVQSKGGGRLLVHECLVKVRTVFDGAGTVLFDVGKSGALERYAKDVDGKTATGDFLGSGTTSVKPANPEANGVIPVITITSGSGNISTWTTGEADVYLLVSAMP